MDSGFIESSDNKIGTYRFTFGSINANTLATLLLHPRGLSVIQTLYCLYNESFRELEASKCCTPDQWESSVYFDWAQVFIDQDSKLQKQRLPETLYTYYNASGIVAYDYTNRRTYMKLSGFELTPLVPGPEPFESIILNDYNKNMQFQVSGSHCDKSKLDSKIIKQCVPDDAEVIDSGFIESNVNKIETYRFKFGSLNANTLATLLIGHQGTCLPIHASFYVGSVNPGSGTVYNMDVMNATQGITDKSIFQPPKQCL